MLKADLDDSVSELGTVCDVSQYRIYLLKICKLMYIL